MSVEVAKQAIDFLVKHSENSKEISIGFYAVAGSSTDKRSGRLCRGGV